MKNINQEKMANIIAGSNRQCFIDGFLTVYAIATFATSGAVAVAGALIGGLFAGNSNGCFN